MMGFSNEELDALASEEFAKIRQRIERAPVRDPERHLEAAFNAGIAFGLELSKRMTAMLAAREAAK